NRFVFNLDDSSRVETIDKPLARLEVRNECRFKRWVCFNSRKSFTFCCCVLLFPSPHTVTNANNNTSSWSSFSGVRDVDRPRVFEAIFPHDYLARHWDESVLSYIFCNSVLCGVAHGFFPFECGFDPSASTMAYMVFLPWVYSYKMPPSFNV